MFPKPLTPQEVADQLRCSRRHIYDLFNEGELAGFKVGSHIKIFPASVDDFIHRHTNVKPPLNEQQGLVASDPPSTLNIKQPDIPAARPSPRPRSGRPAPPQVGFRHLRPTPLPAEP